MNLILLFSQIPFFDILNDIGFKIFHTKIISFKKKKKIGELEQVGSFKYIKKYCLGIKRILYNM